jgi:hypothetical protein
MRKAWLILGLALLAVPVVCAQAHQDASEPAAKPTAAHEAFEITIIFQRYSNDKRVTDRRYTLLATTGEMLPAVRDDDRYHPSPTSTDGLDHNYDVDILGLRREGASIFVALRISTEEFSRIAPENIPDDDPHGLAKMAMETSKHQYLVTPTIPIGKLVRVYVGLQTMQHRHEEMLVEVKPYRPDQDALGDAPGDATADN